MKDMAERTRYRPSTQSPSRITNRMMRISKHVFKTNDCLIAGSVGAVAFVLYLRTLAPGLLAGDSGEFQFAAWLGGFAHPTGYPFYLLSGWLWTHLLPWHDPAWRMNLFSALWGAVAVGLVYLLARRVIPAPRAPAGIFMPRLAALFAALTFAATPTFWSQAVAAEVYTLHAAFVAIMLLALLIWNDRPTRGGAYALAALYGLSLTHHRTMLLLAPALLAALWLIYRRETALCRRVVPLRDLIIVGAVACLPLLLYLTIPLTAPRAPYARVLIGPDETLALYQPTLAGFVGYITGQEFNAAFRSPTGALGRLMPSLRWLANEITWGGVALGLLGLGWLARRASPRRGLHLVLTGLSFLALLIFNLFYGIGDIYVFYIPLYLIWVVWMALGLTAVVNAIQRRAPRGIPAAAQRWIPLSLYLLALALPAYLVMHNFVIVDQSHNDAARAVWRDILAEPIPADAILVTNDRDEMMPLWYLQYVEGVRPDLTGVFPLIRPTPAWRDVGAVTDSALRSGRPVLLTKPMPGLDVKFRLESAAGRRLERVLGRVADRPPDQPTDAVFGDAIRLIGYDLRQTGLASGGPVTLTLYWQPLHSLDADYTTFIQLFDAAGAKIAQSDQRAGGVYYPTTLWKPGEILGDTHRLTLPANPGRPPYKLLVGLYTGTTDLRHLGEPQTIRILDQ